MITITLPYWFFYFMALLALIESVHILCKIGLLYLTWRLKTQGR